MLLFCMSISGTVPLLICLLLRLFMRKSFPYHLGKSLLLISMIFYLVPVQLIKYLLPGLILNYIHVGEESGFCINIQDSLSVHIGKQSLWIPECYVYAAILWFFVVLIFCIYEVIKYNHQIRLLKKFSCEKVIDIPSAGKQKIRITDRIQAPYTVGFLHPFIIFPESLLDHECAGLILKHEYTHRLHHDSLMKLICLVIICLHWINPLAILLLIFYCSFSEFLADEAATDGCTREQKKSYMKAMIELSSTPTEMPIIWKNGFFSGKHLLRKRMEYIMKKRTISKFKKGCAAFAACAAILASSSTILAYNPFQTATENDSNVMDLEFLEYTDINEHNIIDFSHSDLVFVTEDNIQIPVQENAASPYALICTHTFSNGTLSGHKSNSSGGCTVYVYNARRCTKCGHLEINELIKTITYVKCPH